MIYCCEAPDRVDETKKYRIVKGEITITGEEAKRQGKQEKAFLLGLVQTRSASSTSGLGDEEDSVPKPVVVVTITGGAVTFMIVQVARDDWASSDDTLWKIAR